jgi:hypothetical protein
MWWFLPRKSTSAVADHCHTVLITFQCIVHRQTIASARYLAHTIARQRQRTFVIIPSEQLAYLDGT